MNTEYEGKLPEDAKGYALVGRLVIFTPTDCFPEYYFCEAKVGEQDVAQWLDSLPLEGKKIIILVTEVE